MAVIPSEIIESFARRFPENAAGGLETPPKIYRAPGRVNLIGEHTDYNLGFVLPIAIDLACYIAVAPSPDGKLRIFSEDFDDEFAIDVDAIENAKPAKAWHDYPLGVAQELVRAGYSILPADLLIRSSVPAGSGLSSSAAFEIATAIALLGGRTLDPLELARLGQRAESGFVGMPCGIMDQYASVFGRQGSALQIDCRAQQHVYAPLPPDVAVVAVNSKVKHELGSSAYRERVRECAEAVAALSEFDSSIVSLRDVSPEFFEAHAAHLPEIPRKRARHVISDSQRVLDFTAAAAAGNLLRMGELFIESHRSMQYDYEISCEEIDFLVDSAIAMPGVYGARMTGGGFGGCTVNLIAPDTLENVKTSLAAAYHAKYNLEPDFYFCHPAAGAGPVTSGL